MNNNHGVKYDATVHGTSTIRLCLLSKRVYISLPSASIRLPRDISCVEGGASVLRQSKPRDGAGRFRTIGANSGAKTFVLKKAKVR